MGLRLGGLHHWAIIRRKYANFPSFNLCSLYILGLVDVERSNWESGMIGLSVDGTLHGPRTQPRSPQWAFRAPSAGT